MLEERVKCSQKCEVHILYGLMLGGWGLVSGYIVQHRALHICWHSVAGKVQSSVVERVLWVPGATSWSRLSGSCPKLDNTLTVEQCPLSVTPHYILCTTAPESRRQRAATGDGRGRSSPVLHRTLSKAVIRPRGPSPEL